MRYPMGPTYSMFVAVLDYCISNRYSVGCQQKATILVGYRYCTKITVRLVSAVILQLLFVQPPSIGVGGTGMPLCSMQR